MKSHHLTIASIVATLAIPTTAFAQTPEGAVDSQPVVTRAPSATHTPQDKRVVITAYFDSLQNWLQLRRKLAKVPGNHVTLSSISKTEATLDVQTQNGRDALIVALITSGLAVNVTDETIVVELTPKG